MRRRGCIVESNAWYCRRNGTVLSCIAVATIVATVYILYAVKEYSVYLNYGYIRSHSLEIIADDSKYSFLAVLVLIPVVAAFSFFQAKWAEFVQRGASVKVIFGALVVVGLFDIIVVRPAFLAYTMLHETERGGYLVMGTDMTNGLLLLPSCISTLFRLLVAASFLSAIQCYRDSAKNRLSSIAATCLLLYLIAFLAYHVTHLNYSEYYPINMACIECYSWLWYYTLDLVDSLCTKEVGRRGKWTLALLALWVTLFAMTSMHMGSIYEPPEILPVQFCLWAYGMPALAFFLIAMVCVALVATYGWYIQREDTRCYTSVFWVYLILKWLYAIMTLFIPDLYGDQMFVLPFSGPYAIMDWLCFGSCVMGFFQR